MYCIQCLQLRINHYNINIYKIIKWLIIINNKNLYLNIILLYYTKIYINKYCVKNI